MSTHQAGIFDEGAEHHVFLEFGLRAGSSTLPRTELATAPVHAGAQVVAFGTELADAPVPAFRTIEGLGGYTAPGTQQDIFVWQHGLRRDELFSRALAWRDALASVADVAFENHGFKYRDSRDLTGFVDGTANPKADARFAAALTADGGSYVLAQRWVHDLTGFGALPVPDQERVFGRTKADSVELPGDAMPEDSHVSRTDLPGTKIWRRSAPVGGVRDPGLFFLAFGADVERFQTLLSSMFGLTGDGRHDRMLKFSKPVTGSFYYASSTAELAAAFAG